MMQMQLCMQKSTCGIATGDGDEAYTKLCEGETTFNGSKRVRSVGGGCGSGLKPAAQKLLFILVYLKTYPLQIVMGEMFDMSQAGANQWIHRLLPVIRLALDRMGVKPERQGDQFAESERSRNDPKDYIVDGTERRRQRPKDAEKQALHYSGKKKMHSDKNIVIVNRKSKRVGFLGATYEGKAHDKKMVDDAKVKYPRGTLLHKDTGFHGYEPAVRETRQPKKSRAAKS